MTERNLSSLIGARYCHYEFRHWRNACRKALGMLPVPVIPDPDPTLLLRFELLDARRSQEPSA